MSHEIRTPMNGVIGMIGCAAQSSIRGDQIEMVDVIRESAFSLLSISAHPRLLQDRGGRLDVERIPAVGVPKVRYSDGSRRRPTRESRPPSRSGHRILSGAAHRSCRSRRSSACGFHGSLQRETRTFARLGPLKLGRTLFYSLFQVIIELTKRRLGVSQGGDIGVCTRARFASVLKAHTPTQKPEPLRGCLEIVLDAALGGGDREAGREPYRRSP